jgi:hypothetical protein
MRSCRCSNLYPAGTKKPSGQRQKAPNDVTWFLRRNNTMQDARNQIRRFQQYLSDTTKGLQEKRAEIEKAEVYSGQ